MNRKHFLIATIISVVLLTAAFIPLSRQQDGSYDPWIDYNDDGVVDVRDLSMLSQVYGSSGDTTKNVNVMNWPVSTDVTVWWQEALSPSDYRWSSFYNASGFGYLHVLMIADGLFNGESVDVQIYGQLPNPPHTGSYLIRVYTTTLDPGLNSDAITMPVPSEIFRFYISASASTTALFSLSFYLTWA